jgi:hypothetical protein
VKPAAATSISITARDLAILSFVFSVDGCNVRHLLRRFFPTFSSLPYGPTSSAYQRVGKLVESGYLRSRRLPSLSGLGSGKQFLTIGPTAYPLLSHLLEIPRAELHRARQELSSLPADHHFAIVDLLISLQVATEGQRSIDLQDWVAERELRRTPFRLKDPRGGGCLVLIPDGAFTLTLSSGASQPFYLEMDMGTVSPKRLQAKLRGYLSCLRDRPRVILWVVPSRRRQEAIVAWALEQADALSADPSIFWITTREAINERTVLAPIWQVAGVAQPMALVPALSLIPSQPASSARATGDSSLPPPAPLWLSGIPPHHN